MSRCEPIVQLAEATAEGDRFRKEGKIEQAIEAYLVSASSTEIPSASISLRLARCYQEIQNYREALHCALAVVDAGDDFQSWQSASAIAVSTARECGNSFKRVKLALVGSYTTTQFVSMLRLAALRLGIMLEIYENYFGQYRQDIIDPDSPMYQFHPDFVALVVHDRELALADYSFSPERDVEAELQRWTMLWQSIRKNSGARAVQHNFAIAYETPMGHLGARLSGSRYMMTQRLNARLGEQAGDDVLIVDCERLASLFGKRRWFDPRYWNLSKQGVALEALPLVARHTAAVVAADMGLSRKCLALDLDNTLWGGVIGEDGMAGIKLGGDAEGESFVAFQEYILKLKKRGIILAVVSKNNEADAREPFEKHPEMRIKLDDISLFVANWGTKPDGIREIAKGLNIGLDSIVFVDDNPAERQAVRQLLPEVDVISLPGDPSEYARALSDYLMFEASSFTTEDLRRSEQYRARAEIAELEVSALSIEDFYRSLRMDATVSSFTEIDMPRIAQLVGKTNQFNLTTRRHGLADLQEFARDPNCVHIALRLRDRFTDHGLVSLLIAFRYGDTLDIDTWLMSCRVIGRTVEAEMLKQLCRQAERLGCRIIRGTYLPTTKNALVKDIFPKYDFELLEENQDSTVWTYDLRKKGPIESSFITVLNHSEIANDAT